MNTAREKQEHKKSCLEPFRDKDSLISYIFILFF